jgi:hypothetical protein
MAASKSPRARLLHIRDEIEGVAAAIKNLSFDQYRASYIHRRAVERGSPDYLGSREGTAAGLSDPV